MATASTELLELTAGFTADWDKTLADYPATSYTLKYTLAPIAGGTVKEFVATATGDTHNVRLTPADTAQFNAGDYVLTGYVVDTATDGQATKAEVSRNRVKVLPAPDSKVDRRTYAEEVLAEIRTTYKKLAANTISSATVNGRTYTKRDLEALRSQIVYWEDKVKAEQGKSVRGIAVEFKRPS